MLDSTSIQLQRVERNIPSGAQLLQGRRHRTPQAVNDYTAFEPQPWGVPAPVQEVALFGPARIHANTAARRQNDDFEILPAGALGIRPEIQNEPNDPGSNENEGALRCWYTQEPGPNRHRLRKKPPVPRLRYDIVQRGKSEARVPSKARVDVRTDIIAPYLALTILQYHEKSTEYGVST